MIYVTPRTYHQTLGKHVSMSNPGEFEGADTLEIISSNLVLKNAMDRIVMDPAFSMNLPGAVSEFFYLMGGEELNAPLIPWAPSVSQDIVNACELLKMPNFEAIIDFKLEVATDFVPPIRSMQLISRHGILDAISTITNEEMLYSFPVTIYFLTIIQEFVARSAGLKLGGHYFDIGTSKVFKSDLHTVTIGGLHPRWPFIMREMPMITIDNIARWQDVVADSYAHPEMLMSNLFKPYAPDEAWEWLNSQAGVILSSALKDSHPLVAAQAYTLINDPSLKRPLRPILHKAGVKETRRRISSK